MIVKKLYINIFLVMSILLIINEVVGYTGEVSTGVGCDKAVFLSDLLGSYHLDESVVLKATSKSGCSKLFTHSQVHDLVGCVSGDVDCDGVRDISDLLEFVSCVRSDSCDDSFDVNFDGLVNIFDLVKVFDCVYYGDCEVLNLDFRDDCEILIEDSLWSCGPGSTGENLDWDAGEGICLNEDCSNAEACILFEDDSLYNNFWPTQNPGVDNAECDALDAVMAPFRNTCCFFSGDGAIISPETCDPGSSDSGLTYNANDGSCTNGCDTSMMPTICNEVEVQVVSDHEGNEYPVVQIGTQTWMAQSLRLTTYTNGGTIYGPFNAGGYYEWYDSNYGWDKWTNPNNGANSGDVDGLLYSATVANEVYGNICPSGYRVPSKTDWETLLSYVGDTQQLKVNEAYWPDWTGTNDYGFNMRPTGARGNPCPLVAGWGSDWVAVSNGDRNPYGKYAAFWSTTAAPPMFSQYRFSFPSYTTGYNDGTGDGYDCDFDDSGTYRVISDGYQIRCMKDGSP